MLANTRIIKNRTYDMICDLLTFNNIIVLEAGDKLKMQCATADKIKMTASLLQILRTQPTRLRYSTLDCSSIPTKIQLRPSV